jgi:transcriptional regulator with GAF, ATPase, and Fis domain
MVVGPGPVGPSGGSDSTSGEFFEALAGIIYAGSDYTSVYEAVCRAAPVLVSGCNRSSLMLREYDSYRSVAASDEVALAVDRAELELGEGPCLDAIKEDSVQCDPDLASRTAWPRLAGYLLEHTPVRGFAGFRLYISDHRVGALNIFSDTSHALDDTAMDQASVLAAFASVALQAVSRNETAESLRRGLDSNREIGKAIGLMMAFHKVSDEEAFAILRKTSQDMNVKLADVAREILDHHNRR